MDLHTVTTLHRPAGRADLAVLDARTVPLAGGTWLMSRPHRDLEGLVDLTDLGWPDLVTSDAGLEVAATCPVSVLAGATPAPGWRAWSLVPACVDAFSASAKVLAWATVGGNVCVGLPAGPMTTLLATLDAEALVWPAAGGERRVAVSDLVVGDGRTGLAAGDVVRSLHVPVAALRSVPAFARVAHTEQGRSGAIVSGRREESGRCVVVLTAGTTRPVVVSDGALPDATGLAAAVAAVTCWHDDHHGSADWRRAQSARLAEQVRTTLADA